MDKDGEIKIVGEDLMVTSQQSAETKVLILLDKKDIPSRNNPIKIGVYLKGELIDEVETNFMGPGTKK